MFISTLVGTGVFYHSHLILEAVNCWLRTFHFYFQVREVILISWRHLPPTLSEFVRPSNGFLAVRGPVAVLKRLPEGSYCQFEQFDQCLG